MADGRSRFHETLDPSESSEKPQTFGLSFVPPPGQKGGNQVENTTPDPTAQSRKTVTIDTKPNNSSAPEGLLSPQSANPPLSRNSSGESTPTSKRSPFSPQVGTYEDFKRGLSESSRLSRASVNDYQAYLQSSETERLRATSSFKSAYESKSFFPSLYLPPSD